MFEQLSQDEEHLKEVQKDAVEREAAMHTNKKIILGEQQKLKKENKGKKDEDVKPDNTPKLIAYIDNSLNVSRFINQVCQQAGRFTEGPTAMNMEQK